MLSLLLRISHYKFNALKMKLSKEKKKREKKEACGYIQYVAEYQRGFHLMDIFLT